MTNDHEKRKRKEEILDWLMAIEERLHRTIRGKFIHLTYAHGDEYAMSDWKRHYLQIMSGDEYVFVSDNETGETLYAVNVSGDAVLTAVWEVMGLLSRKF